MPRFPAGPLPSYDLRMSADRYLDALVFRRVGYRYRKHGFTFDLSQALFSSAGVDAGTHLLLALIAAEADSRDYERVVDLGSGTGTLGICLAGSSGAALEAVDRDALAVVFTERNARLNGLERFSARVGLMPAAPPDDARELVVSNLPAKAGEPVLRMLIAAILRRAALGGGASAMVVVKPLGTLLADELEQRGAEVLAERHTANHTAVVCRCPVVPEIAHDDELSAFVRDSCEFQGPERPYVLQTVYNLPEFDGLSFRTALAFDLLRESRVSASVLLYGCGQGHLLVGLAQRASRRCAFAIADRDVLSLRISVRNAERAGIEPVRSRTVPTAGCLAEDDWAGRSSWIVVNDDPTPGSGWNDEVLELSRSLLADGGRLLLVARSTAVSRFERAARSSYVRTAERRMHGYRASLFRRGR